MENGGRGESQSLRRFQPTVDGFEDKGMDKKCWQPLEDEKEPRHSVGRKTNKQQAKTQTSGPGLDC